jgi:small-conductance mechanosensitive channel
MSAEINSLLKDDKADLSEIRKKADAFRDAVSKSMARRQARLMKSAKKASSSGVSPVSGNPMTDSEIVDEMQKLFRSHGYSLDVKDISIKDGCVHLTGVQHKVLAEICDLTDEEMKRTWRHYEGGYIQTGNSFKINGALRDVEGKGANALRGPISAGDPEWRSLKTYSGVLSGRMTYLP